MGEVKSKRRVSAIVRNRPIREDAARMILMTIRSRLWLLILGPLFLLTNAAPAAGEELPVLIRSFEPTSSPAPPFEGGVFDPKQGESIAFIGGTNTHDQDRYGFLEASLYLSWPDRELSVRNLAWQGDVPGYQARPRYFYTKAGDTQPGSIPDHRERTKPGIIFVCFGKMESLDAGSFASYDDLIGQLSGLTQRIVLVIPTPFFPVGPAKDLAASRNESLEEIATQIREVASQRHLLLVDLFSPLQSDPDPNLSTNGIHLTEAGHQKVAQLTVDQLKFPKPPALTEDAAMMPSLVQAISRKNRLWQQYYRPTNWAFLFGDRQHVPASRDPVNRDERWFVREIDSLPPLILEAEADIHRYAQEAATIKPSR